MSPSQHSAKFIETKAATLEVLELFTSGQIDVLKAAQKLSALRHAMVGDVRDEDWDLFVGIDSEADHLPLNENRKHWNREALARKDVEIKVLQTSFNRARWELREI